MTYTCFYIDKYGNVCKNIVKMVISDKYQIKKKYTCKEHMCELINVHFSINDTIKMKPIIILQ